MPYRPPFDLNEPDPERFRRGYGQTASKPEPAFSLTYPRLTLVVLAALLAVVALGLFDRGGRPRFVPEAELRPVTARGDLAQDEESTIELFEATSPSVVNIATKRVMERRGFLSRRTSLVPEGTGTGFVWDELGHIVTNYHVLLNADAAVVTFGNGASYQARYVGGVPERDLAVLVVDAPAPLLRPIAVGTSEELRVGQKAFAIGYPFGLDQTLTMGVVSGLDRTIRSVAESPLRGMIQTDAAINPGNSGGPLLDSAGLLIGVNTAIATRSGSSSGVGFAIPVGLVNATVTAILRNEPVDRGGGRPLLGIMTDDRLAEELGLQGVVVASVLEDGGAAAAGLQGLSIDAEGRTVLGDVIVALDGTPVRDFEGLLELLEEHEVGDTVVLTLERGPLGRRTREDVRVVLGE